MFAVIEIGFQVIGVLLGIWWFRYIILPLSYGFYWTVRGWVRWYTPLRYLVGAVISVVLVLYLLKVAPYLLQNRFLGIGLVMGILISIIRLLDTSARFVIRDHFAGYIKPHLTIPGTAALKLDPRTQELTDEDRAIARQVWNDCWKHIIFYGAVVVAIIWLGLFARWLGLLLFGGLAIITLFDILKLFIVRGPGTLRTVMTLRSRKTQGTKHYKGMTAVAFVESMVLIQYTFYLYFRLFR